MGMVTPETYDGHDINDANYRAVLGGPDLDTPEGMPIESAVDFGYPYAVGSERVGRDLTLFIRVRADSTDSAFETRVNELKTWFNPHTKASRELVATWPNAPTARRILCKPVSFAVQRPVCIITLHASDPRWESDTNGTYNTTTWNIVGAGGTISAGTTVSIVNAGNTPCRPTLRYTQNVAPSETWLYRSHCVIKNNTATDAHNYPFDITAGAWNSGTLLTGGAGTVQTFAAGTGVGSADASILGNSGSAFVLFRNAGLVYCGTEQIYFASRNGGTLSGCVRGVYNSTAGTHAGSAIIYQSDLAYDGSDVRVTLDDQEIPRWFNATNLAGTATSVWVVLPDLPGWDDVRGGGDLVENGTNLAAGKLFTTGSGGLTDGKTWKTVDGKPAPDGYVWKMKKSDLPGGPVIDLGSAKTFNRVRVLLNGADLGQMPGTFHLHADNTATPTTNITGATVTGHATPTKLHWYTFDFNPVTARYVQCYITATAAAATGIWCEIAEMEVYNARPRVVLKWGNWSVTAPAQDESRKPMFNVTSTNASWDWDDFYDETTEGADRVASWVPRNLQGAGEQQSYKTAGGTVANDTDPAAVLGLMTKDSASVSTHDSFLLAHPFGVTAISMIYRTRQKSTYRTLAVRTQTADGRVYDEWESSGDTSAAWAAAATATDTFARTAQAVYILQKRYRATTAAHYAEVSDVTLTLTNVPTVTRWTDEAIVSADCAIKNTSVTPVQTVYLRGILPLATELTIDCAAMTAKETVSQHSRYGLLAIDAGTAREAWLELAAGTNVLQFSDNTTIGAGTAVTIGVDWRDAYL